MMSHLCNSEDGMPNVAGSTWSRVGMTFQPPSQSPDKH